MTELATTPGDVDQGVGTKEAYCDRLTVFYEIDSPNMQDCNRGKPPKTIGQRR